MAQPVMHGRIGARQKAHKRETGARNPTYDAVERRLCPEPRLSDLLKEGIASLPEVPMMTPTTLARAFAADAASRPWPVADGEVVWAQFLT